MQLKNQSLNNRKVMNLLIEPRKRLHFYFQILDTLVSEVEDDQKLIVKKTSAMLREIYCSADADLVIGAIKGATFDIRRYLPLRLHSTFIVQSSRLRKETLHVFLFDELMVLTKDLKTHYEFMERMFIEQVYLLGCSDKSQEKKCLTFELNEGGIRDKKTYTFYSEDMNCVLEWQMAITKIFTQMMNKLKIKSH